MTKGKLQRWKKRETWNNTFLDKPHTSIFFKSNYIHMVSNEERAEKLELVKIIEKEIALMFNDEKSKIKTLRSDVDNHGTMIIQFCGGLNGKGEWADYFESLSNVTKTVNEKYNMWLIKIENDSLDDMFYATFGIEKKN